MLQGMHPIRQHTMPASDTALKYTPDRGCRAGSGLLQVLVKNGVSEQTGSGTWVKGLRTFKLPTLMRPRAHCGGYFSTVHGHCYCRPLFRYTIFLRVDARLGQARDRDAGPLSGKFEASEARKWSTISHTTTALPSEDLLSVGAWI